MKYHDGRVEVWGGDCRDVLAAGPGGMLLDLIEGEL